MNKYYLSLFAGLIFSLSAVAQSNFGEIRGKVIDSKTKATLDYVNILVQKDGINKGGGFSDEDGNYIVKPLEPGEYTVTSTAVGYQTASYTGVVVTGNNITYLNIEMSSSDQVLDVVKVKAYKTELVKKDENSKSFSDKDLAKLPTRSIGAIAQTSSAVNQTRSGVSFLGQRPDATRVFIDGIPVIGSSSLPQGAQGQIDIIQSGIPAQYGDFTGGAISITTKGPSRKYNKMVEVISSSLFDPYHYNYVQGFLSGPLWIKNKGGGDKEYVALGFQLSGDFRYAEDASPLYGGVWRVNDEKLEEIENNPLAPNPLGSGSVTRSSFLTQEDLVKDRARQNVESFAASAQAKLEYQPNKNTTITGFGSVNYARGNNFSRSNYLMNYKMNTLSTDQTYRTYLKFTQRLRQVNPDDKDKEEKPLISDAFYTVRLDYQTRFFQNESEDHRDNIFNYGYLGKFTSYRAPVYNYNRNESQHIDQNGDTVTRRGYWEFAGHADTLLTFEASDLNQFRANYTTNFYQQMDDLDITVRNSSQIFQGLGLLNGFSVPNTYSLWFNPGTNNVFFQKSQTERITAYAMGEATLNLKNKHDLQFGITYEQNLASRYAIGATQLWTLMPLLTNSHISELDKFETEGYTVGGNHAYDNQGNFLDTVHYNYRVDYDQQTSFDKNLRAKLMETGATDVYGNPITETSYIDVNSLDPSVFSVDMFSADDLWNNGNTYISYYGYDYLGNRDRKRPSLSEFLYDPQNRRVGSFAPIYSAAWLQDKFAFKDLIFRLGVRVERYDANQFVLKDPYSLYPVMTAAEVTDFNGIDVSHPESVGDDYVVYVNNNENPSKVVGYRNGNTWYDDRGVEVSTPDIIAQESANGLIQPALVDAENQEIVKESFEDYTPQINVLPRVWFSFPINTEAQFFANYDVLAQRPQSNFAPINTYYFLEATQGGTIANAALEPRVRTNYELGFKQKLTDNSAISLIAQYAETRNDFGLIRLYQAYPITYNTTANIDFSTTKSFRAEYELRGQGRVSLSANYTLLFADGTGSNINSQAALIAANQPNLRSLYPLDVDIRHKIVAILDYRFEGGSSYRGPRWFGKPIFENSGVNFIINAKSGAPYTKSKIAISSAQADLGRVQRSITDGNPFGSRLPWQFRIDMNAQKVFTLEKKNPKPFRNRAVQVTAFLWVQNLLDQRIINGVYGYTGTPNDDGYLESPQGRQYISEQVNAQSFMDLYNAKVDNPFNYSFPRLARLGVRMAF